MLDLNAKLGNRKEQREYKPCEFVLRGRNEIEQRPIKFFKQSKSESTFIFDMNIAESSGHYVVLILCEINLIL